MNIEQQKKEINEEIQAEYNPNKFRLDPKGYYLIRINRKLNRIEVAFVHNNHVIKKVVYGKNATEIYHTLVKKELIGYMEHAAYLGKELYKAELALRNNLKYVQDDELKLQ